MINFDTFTKIAYNVGDLGNLFDAKGFKRVPKVQKLPNLVTLLLGVLSRNWDMHANQYTITNMDLLC